MSFGARRLPGLDFTLPTTLRERLIGHAVGFTTLTLPVVLYFAFFEWRGMTLGKGLVGLRVVDESGRGVSFRQALLRSIVKFLPWELAPTALWHTPGWAIDPRPGAPQWLGYVAAELLAVG